MIDMLEACPKFGVRVLRLESEILSRRRNEITAVQGVRWDLMLRGGVNGIEICELGDVYQEYSKHCEAAARRGASQA